MSSALARGSIELKLQELFCEASSRGHASSPIPRYGNHAKHKPSSDLQYYSEVMNYHLSQTAPVKDKARVREGHRISPVIVL